jgi:GntR family transcriptional regulator
MYMYTVPAGVPDRSSPLPIYVQLAGWAESMISTGEFPVGTQLPAESRLARDFRLNRNTVRQAIALLAERGLVEKKRGVGAFVKRRSALAPTHQLGRMTSFIDDFEMADVAIEDKILAQEKARAGAELASKLKVHPGDPVVVIERLRIADGIPFLLEKQFYPWEQFAGLLETEIKGSMYQLLTSRFHADLHHSIQTLRAVRPSQGIAAKLGVSRDVPCMFLESLAYTSRGECLEVLQSYYRGDRYLFKVEAGQYRRDMSSIAPS